MRIFGFSIAVTLFLAFASCDAKADVKPPVADVHAATAATHQVHPDARTKQTFDKTTTTHMPRDIAQQLRADQLELNLIQEQLRDHTDPLIKRINGVLAEYGTQIQDVEFDTGLIHRAPKPPTPPAPVASKPTPAAPPSKTPPVTPPVKK